MNIKKSQRKTHLFKNFNEIINTDFITYEFDLDCNLIPSFEKFDFHNRKSGYLKEFFEVLDTIKTPTLYWFESENENYSHLAELAITEFSKNYQNHKRTTPALNKNTKSPYLYVGVRRGGVRKKDGFTNISGRMFQHLGYYSKGSTQGLQLTHWAKHKFKITILVLKPEAKLYLNVLEKLYAIELKPLIGKH